MRTINDNGLTLMSACEGLKLTAYLDGGNPPKWTIGRGRTLYDDGTPVKKGDECTQEQADAWFLDDIRTKGSHFLDAWIKRVDVLNDNQYAALTSFCYNLGAGAFHHSTVFNLIVSGASDRDIANAFLPYDEAGYDNHLPGLAKRRRAERALYVSDIGGMEEELTK